MNMYERNYGIENTYITPLVFRSDRFNVFNVDREYCMVTDENSIYNKLTINECSYLQDKFSELMNYRISNRPVSVSMVTDAQRKDMNKQSIVVVKETINKKLLLL